MEKLVSGQVAVCYPAGYLDYAKAIVRLLQTALDICEEKFGFTYNCSIKVEMTKTDALALGSEGFKSEIRWSFGEDQHLQPPDKGGPWMVYGFLHELGHLVMPFWNLLVSSMLREGFAHYFALSAMPLVWERIGEAAWPIPHNYWEQEQKRRVNMFFPRQKDAEANSYSIYAVSWYFWQLEQQHGSQAIGRIVRRFNSSGGLTEEDLMRVIEEVTGESAVEFKHLFPAPPDLSSVLKRWYSSNN